MTTASPDAPVLEHPDPAGPSRATGCGGPRAGGSRLSPPRRTRLARALRGAAGLAVISLLAWSATSLATQPARPPERLAPYVPTPHDVVDRMLELAGVTRSDVVYDLGCGDGRLVIRAAVRFGARGVGVDIDPVRVAESRTNAARAGVSHLVTFRQEDALQTDVSEATVVTLYLLSSANMRLRPRLTSQLRPGARIVSHDFGMGDWEPDRIERFTDAAGTERRLYLWVADGRVRP